MTIKATLRPRYEGLTDFNYQKKLFLVLILLKTMVDFSENIFMHNSTKGKNFKKFYLLDSELFSDLGD